MTWWTWTLATLSKTKQPEPEDLRWPESHDWQLGHLGSAPNGLSFYRPSSTWLRAQRDKAEIILPAQTLSDPVLRQPSHWVGEARHGHSHVFPKLPAVVETVRIASSHSLHSGQQVCRVVAFWWNVNKVGASYGMVEVPRSSKEGVVPRGQGAKQDGLGSLVRCAKDVSLLCAFVYILMT